MDDLRERILANLVGDALIGFLTQQGHNLRRAGGEYKMLCPFHDDHTASLCINPRKREGGIFKCFSCNWSGDVFDFTGEIHGVDGFRDRLKLVAELLGIQTSGSPVARGKGPVKRAAIESKPIETMSAAEVLGAYERYKAAAEDPGPWAERLGVSPKAFGLTGSLVAPLETSPDRMVLVTPMRQVDGILCSLQFRCFDTKRRWSLDMKERRAGRWEQVKCSTAGVMTTPETFDPDLCLDGMMTLVIEGSTDLLGGITIILRDYDEHPSGWPVRIIALPGVGNCHDLLLNIRSTKMTFIFFDGDGAGMRSVFWHRRWRMVEDESGARKQEENLDEPPVPGLLQRFRDAGKTARASFPPRTEDGKKYDLRDMARDGWRWSNLYEHLLTTGTGDPHGERYRRPA